MANVTSDVEIGQYIFADFVLELLRLYGFDQSAVARRLALLEQERPALFKGRNKGAFMLKAISPETLCKIIKVRNGRTGELYRKKPLGASTGKAIFLAILDCDWGGKGSTEGRPDLNDADQLWQQFQQRLRSAPSEAGSAPAARDGHARSADNGDGPVAVPTPSTDTTLVVTSSPYDQPEARLEAEARDSGHAKSALLLGALRVLDGRLSEGASWAALATSLGSPDAALFPPATRADDLRSRAADVAVRYAGELINANRSIREAMLFLRRAAPLRHDAAAQLAELYDRMGDPGAAARWRMAAAQ